jgi:hypothetical protein
MEMGERSPRHALSSAVNALAHNIRLLTLVLGFLLGLLGTLGSFFFVDAASDDVEEASGRRSAATSEIDNLGRLAADYFIANQQGNLIWALSTFQSQNPGLLESIRQGNLLDRAEPIRNIIGAMAIAGLLDYTTVYGEYERLNDVARESLADEDIAEVQFYEQAVVQEAQTRVAELQLSLTELNAAVARAEADLRDRQQLMILLTSAGAFLLLLANLIEYRRSRPRAAPAARPE